MKKIKSKVTDSEMYITLAEQLFLYSKENSEKAERLTAEAEALIESGSKDEAKLKQLAHAAKHAMKDAKLFLRDANFFLKKAKTNMKNEK